MKIKKIAFVGVPVTDMQRAREFYEDVLGLEPDPEMTGEHWTEYSIGEGGHWLSLVLANNGSRRTKARVPRSKWKMWRRQLRNWSSERSPMIKSIRRFAAWPSSRTPTATS